jgi:hypothetical protein
LANREIKQLIEAFFRSGADDEQQVPDEVIVDRDDRKHYEDRNRRIKSQQNPNGRGLVQGLTFAPITHDKVDPQIFISPTNSISGWG